FVDTVGASQTRWQSRGWLSSRGKREQNGAAKRITSGIGWITCITGSQDGKVLTFIRENLMSSILIGTVGTDGARLIDQKKLTYDENQNIASAWTPDSKAILFHANHGGTSQIFK